MASSSQSSKEDKNEGEELLDTVRSVYGAVAVAGATMTASNSIAKLTCSNPVSPSFDGKIWVITS